MAARTFKALGTDLALTRFVGTPSAVRLDTADSWGALDLAIVPGTRGRPRPDPNVGDLGTVAERDNLGQALILRLLTPRGALAGLGHDRFGSRLGELVGRLNDATTRNLARLHVLEALAEEPRVREVTGLSVEVAPGSPDAIRASFSVLPVGDDDPLALGLDVILQ
jgi:phage baseplate assembly protein W